METRPGRTSQPPSGEELIRSVQEKFRKDVLPVLKENERWRNRSRRADFTTCLPGGCPKLGDWPKPRFSIDED